MFNEVISEGVRIPVKIWAKNLEEGARKQAINLANMPCAFHHVSLMPDAHQGYGMPIGGVLALKNAVCPNAVGVDIGCGMIAIRTDVKAEALKEMSVRRKFQQLAKSRIPVGEGHAHKDLQEWKGFDEYAAEIDADPCHIDWVSDTDRRNLGTLGGGNHFIELQQDDSSDHFVWLMIHSGSRNLGKRIADHYNKIAFDLCTKFFVNLPDKDLAFLPTSTPEGESYIRAMNFALKYARESRKRMMDAAFACLAQVCGELGVSCNEVFRHDIHHNYAVMENHFGENVWIHRKGATSAKLGEVGIIPGSMGTASYIVTGRGSEESFCSCSHGSGRKMSRTDACYRLTVEECDKAMEGIVCDRWSKARLRGKKHEGADLYDLSEAPGAYKDIEEVIRAEEDLVDTEVRLTPLAVLKG